ncbi:hypothetical protein BGX27_004932 [Mortierella sp. AM989]|nr:hypothetical protein BGX27_004932 [Mortierella sp. AM989]
MRDQLTRSLERLNTRFVDILFVHNPEYYLMSNVKDTEVSVKKHQDILLGRISILFEELEREIERGRIRAYGISSNSFSLKPSHAHFLPYRDLVKMASRAFERVQRHVQHLPATPLVMNSHSSVIIEPTQRKSHGLGFLQMPGNLLEMEGIQTTAKWAKSQGLSVFINRPLNAISSDHHPVRLASHPQPRSPTYTEAKDQILTILSVVGQTREYLQSKMQRLREIIESLDTSLRVSTISIMDLEGPCISNQLHQELARPVRTKSTFQLHSHATPSSTQQQAHNHGDTPGHGHQEGSSHQYRYQSQSYNDKKTLNGAFQRTSVKPSIQEIDQLVKYIDQFIQAFYQQVRFQESSRVEKMLIDRGIDLEGKSIETFAVEYLLEHSQVDSVLLGMKREAYVDFAHNFLKTATGVK